MDPATRPLDRRALLTVASAAFTVALAGCGADGADVPVDDTDNDDGDVADDDHTGDPVDDADDADHTDDERPTPGLAPEEALETFALPDGWTIELVAAEPLIDSPVDVKWDARGGSGSSRCRITWQFAGRRGGGRRGRGYGLRPATDRGAPWLGRRDHRRRAERSREAPRGYGRRRPDGRGDDPWVLQNSRTLARLWRTVFRTVT